MRNKYIDNYYPLVIGAIVSLLYLFLFSVYPKYALLHSLRDLFLASITINSIYIAFIATAKATLIAINGSKVIKNLKESGTYQTLIKYFVDAVNISLICAIWSALVLLIDFSNPTKYILFGIAVWIFLSTTSTLYMYRIIRLFSKILKSM